MKSRLDLSLQLKGIRLQSLAKVLILFIVLQDIEQNILYHFQGITDQATKLIWVTLRGHYCNVTNKAFNKLVRLEE